MARTRALLRAWTLAALGPAWTLALPIYVGLGLVAAVIFAGPNGMKAADVTDVARGSLLARGVLLAGWAALLFAPARALVAGPTVWVVRTAPFSVAALLALDAAGLATLHAAWALLWFRGAGPLAAVSATACAVALTGLLLARRRRTARFALALAALLAALLALSSGALALAPSLLAAALALPLAFHDALVETAPRAGAPFAGPPTRVLASLYARHLTRIDAAVLVRSLLLCAAGGALAGLTFHNNPTYTPGDRWRALLAWTALPLAVSAGSVATSVVALERRIQWLLATTAQPPRALLGASLAASGGGAALLGSALGLAVASVTRATWGARAAAGGAVALWGALLAVLVEACVRVYAARGADRARGAAVVGVLGVGATVLAAVAGLRALAVLALLAVAALAVGAHYARAEGAR